MKNHRKSARIPAEFPTDMYKSYCVIIPQENPQHKI